MMSGFLSGWIDVAAARRSRNFGKKSGVARAIGMDATKTKVQSEAAWPGRRRCGPSESFWVPLASEGTNMKRFAKLLVGFVKDESGTETLEWGLVCGLIVVGAITAIALIGPKVTDMWNDVNNEIPPAD
jgi:Flp pilus assembly pilin Flp